MEKELILTPVEEKEERVFLADRNVEAVMKTAESPYKAVYMHDLEQGWARKSDFTAYVPKVDKDDSFIERIKTGILEPLADNPLNSAKSFVKGAARGTIQGIVNFPAELVRSNMDLTTSVGKVPYDLLIANEGKILQGMMAREDAASEENQREIRRKAARILHLEKVRDAAFEYNDKIITSTRNMQEKTKAFLDSVSALRQNEEDNPLFWDMGQTVPSLASSVGLAFFTKNPVAAAKAFGLGAQSSFYNELREGGLSTSEALALSVPAGAAEGLLEKVGLHVFIENAAVRGMGGSIIRNMFSEAVQEFSQQVSSNAFNVIARNTFGANIEAPETFSAFLYDSVYAGILGGLSAGVVSPLTAPVARRQTQDVSAQFEAAGMEKQNAQETAAFLVYNERVGEMAQAIAAAQESGDRKYALEVLEKHASEAEKNAGKTYWSDLSSEQKEEFLDSLLFTPEQIVSEAVQAANDMMDPDTDEAPTPEGQARYFSDTLDNYIAGMDQAAQEAEERRENALTDAALKSAEQRRILEERKDLSGTDKQILGDLLEAFNASVADKFGVENIEDVTVRTPFSEMTDLSPVSQALQDEFMERAGIYEYEEGLTREEAEALAARDVFGKARREADAFADTYRQAAQEDENALPFWQTVQASAADVSTEEDVKAVRADAKRYLKEIIRKQDIVHPKLGKIRVSDKGIEEFIKYSSDIRKLALVPHLKELIETSAVGTEEAPYHPRNDGIVSFIPLYNEAVIDGVPAKTETLIGVDENGNLFYDVFLDGKRGRRSSNPGAKSGPASTASDINITISEEKGKKPYYQDEETRRGSYVPEERLITLMKEANPSTIVHEMGHHFTMQYIRLLQENGRTAEIDGILKWLGADDAQSITREQWEKLADAFIVYTKEGFAPSSKLDQLFSALKRFLSNLYEKLVVEAGRLPEINDDVRAFFDTMLTVENKTETDFKELRKKARDLREVVQGILRGEALEVGGLSVDDVKALVRALHQRIPRVPKTLEQKIRQAGGISIDFAENFDLIPLLGKEKSAFGNHGLFRRNGAIDSETALIEFLQNEGFLQRAEIQSYEDSSRQWEQAEAVLQNAATVYSPADQVQAEARENALQAVAAAQEALAGINYDALLEALSAFRSVHAVAASKDIMKYIDSQLKKIGTQTKRLSEKLVKEARRDAVRQTRLEMKEAEKERRAALKERQKEIISFIRSYPLENKNGLISSVQKAFTTKSLSDILAEVAQKAAAYYEKEKRRRLKAGIEKLVKRTKPAGLKKQKFDYERNKLFEQIRVYDRMTKAAARKTLEGILDESKEPGADAEEILLRKFLTFKAEGMGASSALMESLIKDLEELYQIGRYAKEESDFTRQWTRSIQKDEVRQAILERAEKAGDKKGALFTKAGNLYRSFTNIYSMLNSIGGKALADRYGRPAELNSNQVETRLFYDTRTVKDETKRIFGFRHDGDIQNMVADLKKHKATLSYQIPKLEGQQIEVDTLQVLDIYNAIKNEKTREDYAQAFGAYATADGGRRLNVEDIIDEMLTPQMKQWGDLMQEAVNSYYDELNRAFIRRYGTDLPKIENYWPATSEHFKETDVLTETNFVENVSGGSFLKERVKGSVIPRPVDAFIKYSTHVNEVVNFLGMEPIYTELLDVFHSLRVSLAIKEKYGNGVYQNLLQQIRNLWVFNQSRTLAEQEKWYRRGLNNWVGAKVALNPRVFVSQLMSFTNYAENMPISDFSKGFAYAVAHPKEVAAYMNRAAPFIEARYARGFNEAMTRMLSSESSGSALFGLVSPSMKYNMKNILSFLVRVGDRSAIIYGGFAYIKYLTEVKGMSLEAAAKEFEFQTLRTQQSGAAGSLSNLQASGSLWANTFLAFKNTPLQYLRKIVDAWQMYRNQDIDSTQFAKTAGNYLIVQSVLYVMGKYLYDQAADALTGGGDDDDDKAQKLGWDLINQIAFGPLDGIPAVSDMIRHLAETAEGQKKYAQNIISMPMIDDIERALRKLSKKEKGVWDFYDIMTPFMEILTGLPVATAGRYARKITQE